MIPVTAILPIAVLSLAVVTCAFCNLAILRRNRRVIAAFDARFAAQDEQIKAYERLIAAQRGLLEAQGATIRRQVERIVLLEVERLT